MSEREGLPLLTLIPGESLEVDWTTLHQHGIPYLSGRGTNCEITLEQRPPYAEQSFGDDRGRWVANANDRSFAVHPDPGSQLAMSLDWADGWPRFYFDLTRGLLELEAWLRKRGQLKSADQNEANQ